MNKVKKFKRMVHINITEDQEFALEQLGGPSKGFREMYAFWYANYELFEDQEKRKRAIREKLKTLQG